MAKPKWEMVCRESSTTVNTYTDRLGVPGGWLYRVTTDSIVVMVFVPDPKRDNVGG